MLTGILVQGFVELADQLLKDRPHHRVWHAIWMKIDVLEPLHHLEEQTGLCEPSDRVVEIKLFQHVAHLLAEPGDVVAQIRSEIRRVGEQLLKVVARGVVEGEARGFAQLRVQVLEPPVEPGVCFQDALFRRRKHAIEPAEDRQWKNDVLIFPSTKRIAD